MRSTRQDGGKHDAYHQRALLEPGLYGLTYGVHQLRAREDVTSPNFTEKVKIIWSVEPIPRERTHDDMMEVLRQNDELEQLEILKPLPRGKHRRCWLFRATREGEKDFVHITAWDGEDDEINAWARIAPARSTVQKSREHRANKTETGYLALHQMETQLQEEDIEQWCIQIVLPRVGEASCRDMLGRGMDRDMTTDVLCPGMQRLSRR